MGRDTRRACMPCFLEIAETFEVFRALSGTSDSLPSIMGALLQTGQPIGQRKKLRNDCCHRVCPTERWTTNNIRNTHRRRLNTSCPLELENWRES